MVSRKNPFVQHALAVLLLVVVASPAFAAHTRRRQALERGVSDQSASASRLTTKDRLDIFSDAWETIYEKYYDPSFNGVNWRAVRER